MSIDLLEPGDLSTIRNAFDAIASGDKSGLWNAATFHQASDMRDQQFEFFWLALFKYGKKIGRPPDNFMARAFFSALAETLS
jgi:hypothetical protein